MLILKKLIILVTLIISILIATNYFPANSKRMLNQTIAQIHTFVFKENQNNKLFVESLIEDKSMQNYVYSNQHASHFLYSL